MSTGFETKTPITVHPLSKHSNKAWEKLKPHQKLIRVNPIPLKTPVSPNSIRFVCISDTHSFTNEMTHKVPPGDVLLHAGDFTRRGSLQEVICFNDFLGSLPHRHKFVIAGNHELSFDPSKVKHSAPYSIQTPQQDITRQAKQHLRNCVYLEDQAVSVYGIKIYGSPWQPEFAGWAFNVPRGRQLLDIWDRIPEDTDVLLTHTPPIGHGDLCIMGTHVGCVELLSVVQKRVKPLYHIFGHIHEGYGITSDGQTTFINASICNIQYRPVNPPIIFDIPLPQGVTK
ncbi:metallophosphoesterase domain-containing protein 1-like [Ornithodoros turicata]